MTNNSKILDAILNTFDVDTINIKTKENKSKTRNISEWSSYK